MTTETENEMTVDTELTPPDTGIEETTTEDTVEKDTHGVQVDPQALKESILDNSISTGTTQETVVINGEMDAFESAKATPWNIVRQLFDEEISKYVSVAQSAVTSKNWADLTDIYVPITMNDNNGKYCCWECGGAKQMNGYAVLIGDPAGNKPLAMSAYRKCNIPNGKQAVIQVYPSCIFVLTTQYRGMGVVLLYRIAGVEIRDAVYIQSKSRHNQNVTGEPVKHFAIHCQLNKVFNMATHEIRQFSNDLNEITEDSPIIQAAIRKSTIYNCEQAIYIRPFFMLRDGYKDWDIKTTRVEDTYLEEDRVASFLTETLAKFSNLIRGMEYHTFPYLGVQVLDTVEEDGEVAAVMMKIAVFTKKISQSWIIQLSSKNFYKFSDYFMYKSWSKLVDIASNKDSDYRKLYICKYAGN